MTQIKATLLTGGNHIVSKAMQDTLCQYDANVIGRCMPRELFIKTPPLIRLCVQGQLHGNRRPLFRAFLNTNLAAVQCDDFPHQR